MQTEATESKRVDVRAMATCVGESLAPPQAAASASQVPAAALAELEAKMRARETEQKHTVSRLELDLRNHTIEIASLRKLEADLKAALAKVPHILAVTC